MVSTINLFISLFFSLCLLSVCHSKIVDQVYELCNRPTSARLHLECIGFPKTSSDCLSRRSCGMIALLSVIPSINGNHFHDNFNITLVGTHLRDTSKHEMSLILDAAFKPTYHPGEGTYYNCSWTQREQTVEVMVKNPGQLVESIGTGIIDDDLLICTWVFDRRSDAWPTDHEGRKIDLVTRKIEVILYKDYIRSGLLDTRLPIYKSRYLYQNCDSPDVKYCLGSPYCVDTYYECHELLTITQTPSSTRSSNSLDYNLFSFDYVTNNSYYDVTFYTSDASPAFQVICGKYSIESFFIFPNGSQESVSILTSSNTHIDPEFDGLRCNWSLPTTFTTYGVTFDTQRIKYLVKLRHSPNVYVDKAPVALPGFHIDDSLYTTCSSGAFGQECFGLDVDDPSKDCLRTRDCESFAVFTVDADTSWSSSFVEPKITLDLYTAKKFVLSQPGAGGAQGFVMSLTLSFDNDTNGKTVYKCLYNSDGRKSASIEVPFKTRPIRSGTVLNEHDWIRCQWIWWPNGTNWPTNNKSDVIDLVNRRPLIQLSVGGVRKTVSQESVSLPIYKLRYLYQECVNTHDGEENLCLESESGCLKTASCSSLIQMREHSGREAIDVQVLLTQEFDKFELFYTDLEDNSIKIDCYNERNPPVGEVSMVTVSYKMTKTDSFQQINSGNQLIKYNESRTFVMGFSRCFWLQEKQFQLGRMSINSEVNRYNVRLQVTNDEGLVARYSWDGVSFVGYKAKDKKSIPSSSLKLHPFDCWLTSLFIISLSYYHLSFVPHNQIQ